MQTKTNERMEALSNDLKNASRNLWLASLGAASTVEANSRKLFDQLVDKGQHFAGKESAVLPEPLRQAGDKMKSYQQRFEERFEAGMTNALHRFGVPARDDITRLIDKVEKLTQKVEKMAAN